jgi:methylenetetrahydrofolate reductase (NADPH)
MKSEGMAKYMSKRVAGMDVPESLIGRMGGVSKEKAPEEGVKICLETIAELREIEGVHGIHVMAIEWEEIVGEIVEAAGLIPRPQ